MYTLINVKYPLFLSDFNDTLIFSTDFRKCSHFKFCKIFVPWEAGCSMRTDIQADITKLITAFLNFVKAAKKLSVHLP